MVFFCPTCANMLLVENEINGMRLYCQTCPYVYHLQVGGVVVVGGGVLLFILVFVVVLFCFVFSMIRVCFDHLFSQEELSVKLPLETKKVSKEKENNRMGELMIKKKEKKSGMKEKKRREEKRREEKEREEKERGKEKREKRK